MILRLSSKRPRIRVGLFHPFLVGFELPAKGLVRFAQSPGVVFQSAWSMVRQFVVRIEKIVERRASVNEGAQTQIAVSAAQYILDQPCEQTRESLAFRVVKLAVLI
ncbi:MAG TPA: hypothetical protein VK968_00145, partial [Roseimicrobium sp.]|nr:hypothetical protein [Roseimicrobium sp.]